MKRFTSLFILLICFSCTLAAKKGTSIFTHWYEQAEKSIEIHFNFNDLEANRKSVDEISGVVKDGDQEFALDLSVRGKFRRRTCTMPPLKLQFSKDALRAAGLNTHNDYKLVTHCTAGEDGQEAILREHLAYKLYNAINPNASYRTQLLNVTYVNTADGSTTTSYAIMIEDIDELKNRISAANCGDCYNAPLQEFANVETVTLFQYMIGNADYSTRMARNLKLMRTEDGRLTAVPYDFDYSGFVNPSYAKASTHLGQRTVKDRVLKWEFEMTPELNKAASDFLAMEEMLLAEIDNYPPLSSKAKKEITRYVKGFFKELEAGTIGS